LQAGGARLNGLEASILYPDTVSTTLPASGPFHRCRLQDRPAEML